MPAMALRTASNAAASTTNASASTSASSSAVSSSAVTLALATAGDTCAWYASSKCGTPRSCEACLNVAVANDQCGVDSSGACVSLSSADERAFNAVSNPNATKFSGYFPAANFTYCSSDDATCASCKAQWLQQLERGNTNPQGETCVGADGCICIATCELPTRDVRITASLCSGLGALTGYYRHIYIAAIVFGVFLIGVVIFNAWRREKQYDAQAQARRELREQHRERRRQQVPKGPQLSLAGWNSFRKQLLEAEQSHLQQEGEAPVVPLTRGAASRDDESPELLAASRRLGLTAPHRITVGAD